MALVARVTRNGWVVYDDAASFARVTRSGWVQFEAAGGGGNVSVNLTGIALTVTTGTVTPAASVALTGNQASTQVGTLAAALSAALSGLSSTVQVGTLGTSRTVPLTGVAGTVSVGNVSASAGGNVSVALTGVSMAVQAGTVAPALVVSVAGSQATAVQGAVGVARAVGLSGNLLLGTAGNLTATGGEAATRKQSLRRVRYTPGQASVGSIESLVQFLNQELERINDAMESPATHMLLERLSSEPARRFNEQAFIAYADGTNWDPGAGEGIYAYYAGSWKKLG